MNKPLQAFFKVTNEIALTEVRKEDVPSLVENISDIDVYNNTLTIPYPYTEKDGLFFIDLCRKFEIHHHHICNYAIRKNGDMIGGIGFLYNHGVDAHKSEFGYWIGPSHRNQGIMTKVIQKFVEIAFEEKQLFRIDANVFVENKASQRVLEKVGFIKEGLMKATFVKDDQLRDTYLYAMTKQPSISN